MKIEDTVRAAVDQTKFNAIVAKMREATEAKMETSLVPQVVELSAKEFGLTLDESNGVLGHLDPRRRPLPLWAGQRSHPPQSGRQQLRQSHRAGCHRLEHDDHEPLPLETAQRSEVMKCIRT